MSTDTELPKVGVVILNWNGIDDTVECLASVGQNTYPNTAIIVVDNNSQDDSDEVLSKNDGGYVYLRQNKNLGWAGGNNRGIEECVRQNCDFVFLLNNDCTVLPDTIEHLVECDRRHPDVFSFIGSTVKNYYEPDKIDFAGSVTNSGSRLPSKITHNEKPISQSDEADVSVSAHVLGAAMFFRTGLLEEIGYIDERFFLNFDETDWCTRAHKRGRPCGVSTKSFVFHKVGRSLGSAASPLSVYFMTRNHFLYCEKHFGFRTIVRTLKESLWNFRSMAKRIGLRDGMFTLIFSKSPLIIAHRRGILDYFLRRFGDCPDLIRILHKRMSSSKTFM